MVIRGAVILHTIASVLKHWAPFLVAFWTSSGENAIVVTCWVFMLETA